MYTVRGRTVASAATADHGIAALWNPHGTQRIKVLQFAYVAAAAPGAGAGFNLQRITARGTPGSTVTPGISNHSTRGIAPPSGALLDLATYSVQPTPDTVDMGLGWVLAAVAASGVIYNIPGGIVIPPGAGLALLNNAAIAVPAGDVSFVWLEDY